MVQTPSVGRVVHYVSYGTPGGEYASQCRAAIISEVGGWQDVRVGEHPADGQTPRTRELLQEWDDERLALVVLNPTGQFFNDCPHDEEGKEGGTWHWPEYVPGTTVPGTKGHVLARQSPVPDPLSSGGMIDHGDRTPGPDVP